MKMKNLYLASFTLALLLIIVIPFVSAERFEENNFRYGVIESDGTFTAYDNMPINDVNIIGFICNSPDCGTVSGRLWNGNVLNSGDDFIQLVYPTTLLSDNGYGVYMYKSGYIPYEVNADWWGTSKHDPVGPFDNYLSKKSVCKSSIQNFFVTQDEDNIKVSATINSPILHSGPLDYVPQEIKSEYEVRVDFNITVYKDNEVIDFREGNSYIPFSEFDTLDFIIPVNQSGSYKVVLQTSMEQEAKCLDSITNKKEMIIGVVIETIKCNNNNECNDNNVHTFDECKNPGTTDSYCTNTPIACSVDNDCGTTGFIDNEFCSLNDVYKNYKSSICVNKGTTSSYCNVTVTPLPVYDCGEDSCNNTGQPFCKNDDVYRTQSCSDNGCTNGQCVSTPSTHDNLIQDCQYGCNNGACLPAPNQCTVDSNCPPDNYGNNYCENDVVLRDFHDYSCKDGNCSENITTEVIDGCEFGCSNGQCNQPNITCDQNSDCGTTGFIDNEFCSLNDVYKNFKNSTCMNPGAPNSYCNVTITPLPVYDCGEDSCTNFGNNYCKNDNVYHSRTSFDKGCYNNMCYNNQTIEEVLVQECQYGCTDGQCVVEDWCPYVDINKDGNIDSADQVVWKKMQGCVSNTTTNWCNNADINRDNIVDNEDYNIWSANFGKTCPVLFCNMDSECSADYSSDNYCKNDKVVKDLHDFSCANASCMENITTQELESCQFGCNNGACLPQPPQCTVDSQCEDDHYTDNYCKDDNVYREFHDVSCENSSCMEDKTEELVEECNYGCYNGECKEKEEGNNDRKTPHDEKYTDCLIDDSECIEYFKSLEKFDNKDNKDVSKEEQYSYQSTQVYSESENQSISLGKISLTKTTQQGKNLIMNWLPWIILIVLIILIIIIVVVVFRLMI